MLDSQLSMLCYLAQYCLTSGDVPGRQGRGHVSIPTYRCFTCGDGIDLAITANTERMWQSLCGVLEIPELLQDARFSTNEDRYAHKEALWSRLESAFLKRTSADWLARLQECEIPAAPVNAIDKALADPQVRHRKMVVTADYNGAKLALLGNAIKLSRTPADTITAPPNLGEHTRVVLEELLGMSPEEMAANEAAGVILGADQPPPQAKRSVLSKEAL
jgi:crotonobetainyl-CoA:carnitine CoA-transferase CaiB-like acyl-CoA transferase